MVLRPELMLICGYRVGVCSAMVDPDTLSPKLRSTCALFQLGSSEGLPRALIHPTVGSFSTGFLDE